MIFPATDHKRQNRKVLPPSPLGKTDSQKNPEEFLRNGLFRIFGFNVCRELCGVRDDGVAEEGQGDNDGGGAVADSDGSPGAASPQPAEV